MPTPDASPVRLPAGPLNLNNRRAEGALRSWRQQKSAREAPLPPPDLLIEDAEARALLDAVQGNILRPHGRDYVRLLFFSFQGTPTQWRDYLCAARQKVTSAYQQWLDARRVRSGGDANAPFAILALAKDGVILAGSSPPIGWSSHPDFEIGMWKRRGFLGDMDEASDDLPWAEEIFDPNRHTLHGMWLLARNRLEASAPGAGDGLNDLEREIRSLGGSLLSFKPPQDGVGLRDAAKQGLEPFGFRDGVSMPSFFNQEGVRGDLVNLPLTNVLFDGPGAHLGGSFLVYRKLRQDVARFRAAEDEIRAHLHAGGLDEQDPGRLLIGRYRDGRPLTGPGASHAPSGDSSHNAFDFQIDADGTACPFHAHIRKSNPRTAGPLRQNQFVRRGAVFGVNAPRWDGHTPLPERDVGLLFMACMSDINKQFVTMQANWHSSPTFPAPGDGLPEPLSWGTGGKAEWKWHAGLGNRCVAAAALRQLVTPLGGAYFMIPSLAWLENPPPAPPPERTG